MVGSTLLSKAVWVLVPVLVIVVIGVTLLWKKNQTLTFKNAELSAQINKNVDENQQLTLRIESMRLQKWHDQQRLDEWRSQQIKRDAALTEKVKQLEKELDDARCFDEPVIYPEHWVSGYESADRVSRRGEVASVDDTP